MSSKVVKMKRQRITSVDEDEDNWKSGALLVGVEADSTITENFLALSNKTEHTHAL